MYVLYRRWWDGEIWANSVTSIPGEGNNALPRAGEDNDARRGSIMEKCLLLEGDWRKDCNKLYLIYTHIYGIKLFIPKNTILNSPITKYLLYYFMYVSRLNKHMILYYINSRYLVYYRVHVNYIWLNYFIVCIIIQKFQEFVNIMIGIQRSTAFVINHLLIYNIHYLPSW